MRAYVRVCVCVCVFMCVYVCVCVCVFVRISFALTYTFFYEVFSFGRHANACMWIDVLQSSTNSPPATEPGRAGHAPEHGRGVSGAWPGHGNIHAKPIAGWIVRPAR